MRPSSRPTATLAIALLAALGAACGDELTDPDALLESAEAEAVLRSAASLPALPSLIDVLEPAPGGGDDAALQRAHELWVLGVVTDDPRGLARRRLAVRHAAPVLARRLPAQEWREVERGLEDWTSTATAMLRHLSLPAVDRRVQAARRYLDRAAATSDPERRATDLLLAAAELVETTPRYVARTLTAAAVTAVDGAAAGDERRLERADRLKAWAVRAVEEEDYLLAIQRAYYALQLVEDR